MSHFFDVEKVSIRSDKLFLIAGPCVLDDSKAALEVAEEVARISQELEIPFVFKASYQKDNRTSSHSYRGVGMSAGLEQLHQIREKFQVPVLTDVHSASESIEVGKSIDILQIPAFLCRQTSLLEACGKTGKAVNVKKGQFMAPWDMKYAVEKISQSYQKEHGSGQSRVFLTERGTMFGYGNLVVDMRSFPLMKESGCPVIFDGTHSVQLPGAGQGETAGQREMIPSLVRAAVAVGCDGLFLEVHPDPEKSPSDRASILPLSQLKEILVEALAIKKSLQKVSSDKV